MKPGDILCLENTRFHKGEEKNDAAFVAELAKLGDLWVNDAFSAAHRAHASTEGLGHVLPAYAGRSMQAELDALGKALDAPQRPVAAIVGGAKISTKLDLLGNLIAKVNVLIIGGGMANTFLVAQGKNVGKSLAERDLADTARDILAKAKTQGCEIVLPVDAVVAKEFKANAPSRAVSVDAVGNDEMILDIGPKSIEHAVSVLGTGQDAGVERSVRRVRDGTVRHRNRRGRRSRGGTDRRRQACLGSGRRRHRGGAERRGRDRAVHLRFDRRWRVS